MSSEGTTPLHGAAQVTKKNLKNYLNKSHYDFIKMHLWNNLLERCRPPPSSVGGPRTTGRSYCRTADPWGPGCYLHTHTRTNIRLEHTLFCHQAHNYICIQYIYIFFYIHTRTNSLLYMYVLYT